MRKMDEVKVLRDPIHGYIHVYDQIIWDCINTANMQRLRRIHQLGGDFQVYHSAEHSRFSHSLGVYELVRRMVYEVSSIKDACSEYEKVCVMVAALVHDIGHGPFSHAFEGASNVKHEEYTIQLLQGDSNIHDCLKKEGNHLVGDVIKIIQGVHPRVFLNQLVSGELDGDRMDYLLRDAYFTGTSYGTFDVERVIRTIRLKDEKLVVKESGIHSIEDYIMARYHMYWQVYLHPVAKSFEMILTMLFKRMRDVYKSNPELLKDAVMFIPFLTCEKMSNRDFHELDEGAAYYGFLVLSKCDDLILADLAHRILDRDLFDYETNLNKEEIAKIKVMIKKQGFDPKYYVVEDVVKQMAYAPYTPLNKKNAIWVLKGNGKVIEIAQASTIVDALTKASQKIERLIYYPKQF